MAFRAAELGMDWSLERVGGQSVGCAAGGRLGLCQEQCFGFHIFVQLSTSQSQLLLLEFINLDRGTQKWKGLDGKCSRAGRAGGAALPALLCFQRVPVEGLHPALLPWPQQRQESSTSTLLFYCCINSELQGEHL